MKWFNAPDTSKGNFILSVDVTMANEKKHKRPKYTLEFKQDAAKLVLEKGYSQQQAADHLSLSLGALGALGLGGTQAFSH